MGSLISREQFDSITQLKRNCLILNSRQSKRPCRLDEWTSATNAAIRHYSALNYLFLTSIGMNSWEMTLHLVNICGGRQIISIPPDLREYGFESSHDLLRQFRLAPERTYFYSPNGLALPESCTWPQLRDDFLAGAAQVLVPVSVRPMGRLDSLLSSKRSQIDDSFRVRYNKPVDHVRYDWNQVQLNPRLNEFGTFLIHWTRSAFGPPRSTDHFDFYEAILRTDDYPFSALHTLEKILTEQTIRASSRFIRGGHRVVSFTSLSPVDAVKLMRWRKRYAYYSFEPYGIAIECSIAKQLGCQSVSYGAVDEFSALPETRQPFFQNSGSESVDWQPEAEWRCLGDLDLAKIPDDSVQVITYRESEVAKLVKICRFEVVPLTIGD